MYIHQNSGIPLIGTNYFGLVDRDTNIIEFKPITSCNIDCIYCSVAQEKRVMDYVVEKDYLVQECPEADSWVEVSPAIFVLKLSLVLHHHLTDDVPYFQLIEK